MWYRLLGALFILFSFYHSQNIQNYFYLILQRDPVPPLPGLFLTLRGYQILGVKENFLDCSPADIVENVGEGWQKSVFRSAANYAIKKPRLDGPTYVECLQRYQEENCRLEMLNTVINEIKWFYQFRGYPGVVQMLSYCIPTDVLHDLKDVKISVELGEPLTTLYLIQLPWNERKDIISEVLGIIHSLRSFTMNDFRRQQFVIINKKPKLADLDHLTTNHQNETIILDKFQKEFFPFLITSDAPQWFLNGFHNVSTTAALRKILNGDHNECIDDTCN